MIAWWPKSEDKRAVTLRRLARLTLLLLGAVGLLSISFPVSSLSQKLEDFYFRIRSAQPTSSDVALVLIDDTTLSQYGRWPWPRHRLAQLIRAVSNTGPRAIGLDILLSEPEDEKNDAELERAIEAAPNLVLASKISSSLDGNLWIEPLPRFSQKAKGTGHVQAIIDSDGLCRRIPLDEPSIEGVRPAFSLKLAELAKPELVRMVAKGGNSRIAGIERILPRSLIVDYRQQFEAGTKSPPFVTVSAGNLLAGKSAEQLRDKVVVIGFGAIEISDRLFTPVSDQSAMPGAEINANVVDMLLTGRRIKKAGLPLQLTLFLATGLLSLWIVVRWPGAQGLLCLAAILIAGYCGGYFLFVHSHLLLPYGALLMAGVFAAPLAQLENLVVVDRIVTRRLQDLRHIVRPKREPFAQALSLGTSNSSASQLHWKLDALSQLQADLVSLYAFDQTLIQTMQEGLAVFGPGGTLLFSNASWGRFCAKHGGDIGDIGQFNALIGGWRGLQQMEMQAGAWVEAQVPLGDGLWDFRAVRLPWTSHANAGATMVVVEDISAHRQRDQARSEALSFVTHELRTPLIAIQGFAELLMRYPTSPAREDAPAVIFRESRRLVAMINTYLEVLRLDAGARPLKLQDSDVRKMLDHVQQIVQPLAQSAQIEVKTEIRGNVQFAQCDEALISGALLNLVSNAIKYSPAGSVVLMRVILLDEELEFEVRNSGPVISPVDLEHLFEKFYRSPLHSESIPGWGLGLAFVKRICEQHGGSVRVTSSATSGTCFHFTLPMHVVSEALT